MNRQTFNRQVLEASQEKPLVVDFWAPWCGPCKVLGPVIEELANEADGKWELVKINVDESTEVAKAYNILNIPTVIMFSEGKPISQFAGALPKTQIQQWLETHVPDPRKKMLNEIYTRLENGSRDKAINELEEFIDQNPDMIEAKLSLAREKVVDDTQRAEELIADVKIGNRLYEEAEDIRNLIRFMTCEDTSSPELYGMICKAREAYKTHDYAQTLEWLIESIMTDKTYCQEVARVSSIAIFHHLGNDHEITQKYRPRFNMALY